MKTIKSTKSTSRFVICVDNSEYPASLELHKIYRVVPDKDAQADGDLRIIDESGEDYLFPADYFTPNSVTPDNCPCVEQIVCAHICTGLRNDISAHMTSAPISCMMTCLM